MKNMFSKCVLAKDHVFDQQQAAICTNKRNSKQPLHKRDESGRTSAARRLFLRVVQQPLKSVQQNQLVKSLVLFMTRSK